jgi:hypothetical protein
MSRLLWLLALTGVAAVVLAGPGAPATRSSAAFSITRVDIPLFVKENGPKGTRTVYWQGSPTFPVTVHERGICPESVNCGPRNAQGFGTPDGTTVFKTHADPLVTPNYYFCSGTLTSNYVIGVEYWLTDAKGHKTAVVRDFWVCKTH